VSEAEVLRAYSEHVRRRWSFLLLVIVGLIILGAVGVTLGSAREISIPDVVRGILGQGEEWKVQVIRNIRLPRVLSAIVAGVGLSVSGALMQSILRNPLGSPFTLGISSAAAFGAAFAVIVLGAGTLQSASSDAVLIGNPYIVTISAFLWCLVCTGAILALSRLRGASAETLVLAGIALGSLFASGLTAMEYFADDVELASIIFWTFGDLGRSTWRQLAVLTAVVVPISLYFVRNAWNYNALDSGDETAKSLGVDVRRTRTVGMILASLATSTVVSFFGIIGFVGLVVPHIVRRVIGGNEMYLIPTSCLFGGVFLLASDTVARTVVSPLVLPVGILTSFLGAPLFIYLLVKGRSYW
jgi:iron complex transport system permease protein